MKYLKMLGLAAIAAAALTAVVGVGSASAVTLCENNQATGCTSHVNSGQTITFTAEDSIKLAGPFGIVLDTCTESTVKGFTTNTGADNTTTAVNGDIEELTDEGGVHTVPGLTFGKCTRKTTVGIGGTLSITASGTAGNGSVTSNGATVTIHEFPEPFPGTCAYVTTNTPIGTLTASATAATFDISATLNSETANCPQGTWSGHYVSTGTVVRAVAH
jgi:hypothetical protein